MNANNWKNIGIIMGGYSHEHEISLKSGMVVYNTLKEYYNCYRILIEENSWTLIDKNENLNILSCQKLIQIGRNDILLEGFFYH